ncbi:MAG: hypothetical protein C9356_00680 [Oleiphilus sp.]|nr:MAG: hypothetical protein C9356_00680 [Oleiphilus sp.]
MSKEVRSKEIPSTEDQAGKRRAIEIRPAKREDLPSVLAIAQSRSLASQDTDSASQSGFLVSGFSMAAYEHYLSAARYFYVADNAGEIQGFLLAYDSEAISPDETLNTLLRYNLIDPFVLIKQICVADGAGGQGIASGLYSHLFKSADTPRFAASVVIEPYNHASVSFHERRGFQKLCDIVPSEDPDGLRRLRGVWFRDLQSTSLPNQRWIPVDSVNEQTLLMEKQHAAIQLYNHEDNLNWTKFGMLITFMMALLAAADYLLKQPGGFTYQALTLLVVIMGYSINLMFYQKIKSGLKFMNHHKASVNVLDDHLMRLNPNLRRLVKNGDSQISGKSVTSAWMEWIPKISVGIWTACSALLLYAKFLGQ